MSKDIIIKTVTGFLSMSIFSKNTYNKKSPEHWVKCGVYCIKNSINNKVYVGSSRNIYKRFKRHLNELNKNKHINEHLQRAVSNYGIDNFYICILTYSSEEELNSWEQFYIDLLDATNVHYGYNIRPRADGKAMSEATKLKLSIANKGRKRTDEQRQKMSVAGKGRPSQLKGKKLSEEHKQNIKNNAANNPNYGNTGRKHTEEALRKISQASTGRVKSDESKAKQSAQIKGRKYSIKHREAISQANYRRWESYRLNKLKDNS